MSRISVQAIAALRRAIWLPLWFSSQRKIRPRSGPRLMQARLRKPDSADVQALLGQGWVLGELWDRDINDLEFNGAPLYRSEKLKVPTPGGKTLKAWGYEVRSFITVPRALAHSRAHLGVKA